MNLATPRDPKTLATARAEGETATGEEEEDTAASGRSTHAQNRDMRSCRSAAPIATALTLTA